MLESGSCMLSSTLLPHKPSQLQQVSFMVQVLESALRCHARLVAVRCRSVAAVAAAAGVDVDDSTQQMLSVCGYICQNAAALAGEAHKPGNSRAAAVEVQQVFQACMSAQLSALSTAQHGSPGVAFVSAFKVRNQLLNFMPPALPAALPSSMQVPAGLFLSGRCLLSMASHVWRQVMVLGPGRPTLQDWVAGEEDDRGGRLAVELEDLLLSMAELKQLSRILAHTGAQDLLHAVQGVGWGQGLECPGS